MNCPRCETAMDVRPLADVALRECGKCGGLWVAHGVIERMLEDRAGTVLANALLQSVPRVKTSTSPPAGQRMYVQCPTCGALMNRKLFATGAGIVIDVCRADGAFFDAGELPAIVDFVMKGGLEAAARKDASRALEARRAAAQNARLQPRTEPAPSVESDAGGALVDLLFSLFS